MSTTNIRGLTLAFAATMLLALAGVSSAQELRQHASTGGVEIYYGFLPAEVAGKHTAVHDDEPMHGRARRATTTI